MKEIKVAIIGCGAVTRLSYLPELPKIPGLRICYVCDTDPALAKSAALTAGARVAEPGEILEKADAVIIATPPATHSKLIQYYLQKIRTVICEKPFVGTLSEARALVAMASEKGANLFVAHFRRCFPNVTLARSIIETGLIGQVTGLELYEGGRFTWQATSNYTEKERFGGVHFDTGSHTVDMAFFAAGLDTTPLNIELEKVESDGTKPYHMVKAKFAFKTDSCNGNGLLYLSRYEILANLIRIIGEKGVLEFSTGMDNRVRISGISGYSIVTSESSMKTFMDPFRLQYRLMLGNSGNLFDAARFVNLTAFLEKIDCALGGK